MFEFVHRRSKGTAQVAAEVRTGKHNEVGEPFACAEGPNGSLVFGLCDGLHCWGEGLRGSRIAAEAMVRFATTAAGRHALSEAMVQGGRTMVDTMPTDIWPPSCFAVLCELQGTTLDVALAGATPAFLIRGGKIIQRTEPHMLVNELVRSGHLTQEQARGHPLAHVVTRSIGGDPRNSPTATQPDTCRWSIAPGDRVVIAYQRTAEHLGEREFAIIARESPTRGVDTVLTAARRAGIEFEVAAMVVAFE